MTVLDGNLAQARIEGRLYNRPRQAVIFAGGLRHPDAADYGRPPEADGAGSRAAVS